MATTALRSPGTLAQRDLRADQAVVLAVLTMVVVTALDLIGDGRIGVAFGVGFVLVSITVPLCVDVRELFTPGIMPPVLLIGLITALAVVHPSAIHETGLSPSAGLVQRVLAGVIAQATALVVGHLLALALVAVRIVTDPERASVED